MKLTVDYNYVLKAFVGEYGIDISDIEKLNRDTEEIHNRIVDSIENNIIGFFNLPYSDTTQIKSEASRLKSFFKNCVVLGIGGSALGTIAVNKALGDVFSNRLFVIDNIDPDIFDNLLNFINMEETFFVVISKSGSTAETISQFLIIRNKLIEQFGFEGYKKRIIIITDPEKGPLRKLVNEENITSFDVPPNVGGRFSVLSPVGLFPLAFAGIDIDGLLEGALFAVNSLKNSGVFKKQAYMIGSINYLFLKIMKNILVLMPYSTRLSAFADWFRQLWAESLGKDGTGSTPVKAIGTTDQHSQLQLYMEGPRDKLINFIKIENFDSEIVIPEQDVKKEFKYLEGATLNKLINSELDATRVALAKSGVPNYTVIIDRLNPFTLGELIMLYETVTVFTGYLMKINPFDQPGVELSKKYTYSIFGREGYEDMKIEFEGFIKKTDKKFII